MQVPTSAEPAGRVIGTEAATPLEFQVHVIDGRLLQLDDIVTVRREVPGVGGVPVPVDLYGVVTQVRGFHEGIEHHSDVHRVVQGQMYGKTSEVATVMTTRIEPEVFVPPLPGGDVHCVTGAARDRALFLDKIAPERRLPAGLHRTGGAVFLDADFLDGVNGAHVNISGVSGVATKTSYATFLLHAVFHPGSEVLGIGQRHARALVFNVKGQDLLYLDQPNARLSTEQRARWAEVGLPAQPFGSVAFWSPPVKGAAAPVPSSARKDKVKAYWWSLADFCANGMLALLFADIDDDRQQYTAVARNVASALERHAVATPQGGVQVGTRHARTLPELVAIVRDMIEDEDPHWVGRFVNSASVGAFMRRLESAVDHVGHLIRGDAEAYQRHRVRVLDSDEQVNVVDLTPLSGRAQKFVVGALLDAGVHGQGGARHPRPSALRGAGRAQQVRATPGPVADQADPGGDRGARAQPGHHPDRGTADGIQRRRRDHRERRDQGRGPPGPGRGRTLGVPLDARQPARPGDADQPRHDDPQAAARAGAAGGVVPDAGVGDPVRGGRVRHGGGDRRPLRQPLPALRVSVA